MDDRPGEAPLRPVGLPPRRVAGARATQPRSRPVPRICLIQINVTEMDSALDFYTGALGFRVTSREHYPQIVKLEHAAVPLLLYKVEREASDKYRDGAQTIVNIATDDLGRDLARMRNLGIHVVHDEPQPCPVGVHAAIRDPSGNVLELVEYHSRTEDAA